MITTKQPIITIITVAYNVVNTIEKTILSVINQTYPDIEYIIIDGGSFDGTISIIEKYSSKISYWISEKDNGIYDAMNKGIEKANGKYIQFLNASDVLYKKNTIQHIIENLPNNDVDVIYGNIIIERKNEFQYMKPASLETFKNRFPIYHPSTWVKSEIMKKMKFDTTFSIAADFNFFRIIYFQKCQFHYIPIYFTIFDGIEGISSTNPQKLEEEKNIILNIKHNKLQILCKKIKIIYQMILGKVCRFLHLKIKSTTNIDTRIIKSVPKELV